MQVNRFKMLLSVSNQHLWIADSLLETFKNNLHLVLKDNFGWIYAIIICIICMLHHMGGKTFYRDGQYMNFKSEKSRKGNFNILKIML